jgi:hypothetical protein
MYTNETHNELLKLTRDNADLGWQSFVAGRLAFALKLRKNMPWQRLLCA